MLREIIKAGFEFCAVGSVYAPCHIQNQDQPGSPLCGSCKWGSVSAIALEDVQRSGGARVCRKCVDLFKVRDSWSVPEISKVI